MSEIDWSKAPEGATHWVGGNEPWHKHIGDIAWYWQGRQQEWYQLGVCVSDVEDEYRETIVKRPDQAWTGIGLPPVGIDCEYMKRGAAEWFYCTVIAHHDGGAVVAVHEDDLSYSYWNDSSHFRPIRTPEQIAAEERETAVQQMVADSRPMNRRAVCEDLYDAGYRKTEAGK